MRPIRKLFTTSIIVSSLSTAFAQLNESDSISWQVKAAFTGSILDGNIARTLLLNRIELINANPTWGLSTRNDYQYGRTFKKLSESDLISYNFIYYHPQARIYPYVMGLVETNLRRKIDFRYQVGPGLSWNIVQNQSHVVKLSATATFESTRFNGSTFEEVIYDGSNVIETWRATGRIFARHQLASKVRVSYEFWLQQSIQEKVNFRYHAEASLEIPFSQKLAFRSSVRYSYENIQLIGLKPFDLLWTYGLSYTRLSKY
ncbi:MAG: DUF481 domain-containing protein [Cyclobacteriaceae bacterium]|nr:DUF481 domain-containing protein [Cyclobacteriaceae bacterium]